MKRIFILLVVLISTLCSFAQETKKIAILEVVDKNNELSNYQKLMLRTRLAEEVNKAVGFEAYDRANMDAIMNEHNFQRTGFVSEDQIRRLGKMAGATYILVIEGASSGLGSLFVSAVVLDVETAKMVVTESANMASSENGLIQGCSVLARKIFGKLKIISNEYAQETNQQIYIYKHNNHYTYMGSKMDKKAYLNFLRTNCPDAYKTYNKGSKLIIGGWCLLGIGVACVIGGGIHYYIADKNYDDLRTKREYWDYYSKEQKESLRNQRDKYHTISYAIMGVGGGIVVTSIPLLSTGYTFRKNARNIYNANCASPSISPISLNLTAGQNGLGIALQF